MWQSQNNVNLDYFPSNFVIQQQKLWYIDYEYNPYSDDWDFENWGIYYWLNTNGMKEFIKTDNPLAINQFADSGIPIKESFEKKAQQIIERYTWKSSENKNLRSFEII